MQMQLQGGALQWLMRSKWLLMRGLLQTLYGAARQARLVAEAGIPSVWAGTWQFWGLCGCCCACAWGVKIGRAVSCCFGGFWFGEEDI